MGDIEGAKSAFDRGIAIGEGLLARGAGDRRIERELAVTYRSRARTHFEQGQHDLARSVYQKSVDIFERLHAATPDPETKVSLVSSLVESGAAMLVTDALDDAEAVYTRARVLSAELLAIDPNSKSYLRSWAETETRAGDVAVQRGKLDEAYAAFKPVYDTASSYVELMPEDNEVHFGAGHAAMKVALVHMSRQQWVEAVPYYDYAIERYGTVYERNPKADRVVAFLAAMLSSRAEAFHALGDRDRAVGDNTRALELLEPIVESKPDYAEWSLQLAAIYVDQAGMVAEVEATRAEGRAYALKAIAIIERMERDDSLAELYAELPVEARKVLADIDAMK
jgi:tetratricopeptide (TPR) repeat protein